MVEKAVKGKKEKKVEDSLVAEDENEGKKKIKLKFFFSFLLLGRV
jgi:hypothetical protein